MNKARWVTGFMALALCVTAGATPGTAKKKNNAIPDAGLNRVWPPPPQKPRIKLLQVIRGERDVIEKKKRSFLQKLVGERDTQSFIRFLRPYALAEDHEGRLYVTDTYERAVFVMDPTTRDFRIFAGDADVQFRQPMAITVDSKDRVWVADATLRSVLCFNQDEKLLLMFGTDPGTGKVKTPTLKRPAGIALDESRNRVYVSDSKLNQIFVFDMNGKFLGRFGGPGNDPGQFSYPGALLVDKQGRLLVADTINARIQVFSPDLKPIQTIGERGDTPGKLAIPKDMAFDREGHLYVTDAFLNNFQIFGHDPRDPDPNQLSVLLFVGGLGQRPGDFQVPGGIYIDSEDHIFVADQMNGRIQVFQFLGGK